MKYLVISGSNEVATTKNIDIRYCELKKRYRAGDFSQRDYNCDFKYISLTMDRVDKAEEEIESFIFNCTNNQMTFYLS